MSITSLAISLTGMHDAQLRMDAAAHNIANAATEPPVIINEVTSSPKPQGQGVTTYVRSRESVFGVDLASEFVNLKLAQHSYAANAIATSESSETLGTLINMLDDEEEEA